jgi:hypothetical protein
VNNADNSGAGAGALWDYSNTVGIDNILSAAEVSSARTLKFSNTGNEAFTVTFNVIGNLARASAAPGSPGGAPPAGASSGAPAVSSPTGPASLVTNMVFSVTYNPVLNTLTWQLVK